MKTLILALLFFCSCHIQKYKWTLIDNTTGKVYELDKRPVIIKRSGIVYTWINKEQHIFNGNYEIISKPIN